MATSEEYLHWCERHSGRFGLGADGAKLLLEWFAVLGRHAVADLDAATRRLMQAGFADFPNRHPQAVRGQLRRLDAEYHARQCEAAGPSEDRGTCTDCGGTG